ncbi:MAG TPA: hypothetical protein VMW62_13610 [Chloroflexota bacterium]|nr:hypothetical protein [Chloroflexota bacterium]
MVTIEELAARLRALPRFEPDPAWKHRTKGKLLRIMDGRCNMGTVNRWAIFATYEQDPIDFAQWVRAKGRDWRPVAVNPERLGSAVASLQPNLVIIDSHLARRVDLARMVRSSSAAETAIASQSELARIA